MSVIFDVNRRMHHGFGRSNGQILNFSFLFSHPVMRDVTKVSILLLFFNKYVFLRKIIRSTKKPHQQCLVDLINKTLLTNNHTQIPKLLFHIWTVVSDHLVLFPLKRFFVIFLGVQV